MHRQNDHHVIQVVRSVRCFNEPRGRVDEFYAHLAFEQFPRISPFFSSHRHLMLIGINLKGKYFSSFLNFICFLVVDVQFLCLKICCRLHQTYTSNKPLHWATEGFVFF